MTDAELTLRPMTRAEWDEWIPRQMAGYAEHIAASGEMSEADAWEKAKSDTARSFHAGFGTPGQLVFQVMAGDDVVGAIWIGVPGPSADRQMAWVYTIEVDPAYRGRDYGRAAMILAEDEARSHGMTSLGLNVHGQNTVARGLYDSLGYEVMALQMKKPLSPLDRS
ncbi:MAG TPA: GNAT family N-acetyltransferase [Trebonia sp.]|nr:GNAT family N-acetyltransferase [Trebonia sp.]